MTFPPRVLHVNDVAGVGSAAVTQARREHLPWRLWPLPSVRGLTVPAKAVARLADLGRFWPAGRSADVLHVHYGLFAYYAWSVGKPYVLHLHGTDVRVNLHTPSLRPIITAGIRHAAAVVYSTPDMAAAVCAIRPDATWLPAPLHPDLCGDALAPSGIAVGEEPTIVFASRWDPIKGLSTLLELVAQIRHRFPRAQLLGVDWGTGSDRAARAGVTLLPPLSPHAFHDLLASADVVVGQQTTGALGIADLEAMALARPMVVRFDEQAAYASEPAVWNTRTMEPIAAVAAILADPSAAHVRAVETRRWALDHHGAAGFIRGAQALYDGAVERATPGIS